MAKKRSGKPRVSDARGRVYVREVLDMGAGYGYSEEALLNGVNELAAPAEVTWSEVREWVEWNHHKKYIRTQFNEDQNEDLYYITKDGIAKEMLK